MSSFLRRLLCWLGLHDLAPAPDFGPFRYEFICRRCGASVWGNEPG